MRERARRSLKASSEGINQANKALLNLESKVSLAVELEISRATLQKFFAGKPIERENFHKICQRLKLPWEAIADLPLENESAQEKLALESSDLDALVQEVRQKGRAYIQSRCGNMRVLDMSQPIGLNEIYTNVNILEKISSRQRLKMTDLLKICDAKEFDRPNLGITVQDRVIGVEAVKKYSKLIVLGKPGAGKTTFLKHVALQCSNGQMQAHLVPIFISLKDFAEIEHQPSLLEYITEQFSTYGITDPKIAKQLLIQGKMLVLLDGLDEVKEIDHQRVFKSVSRFFSQFYTNHFIVTCRIAAREYTFEEFTEVEIADFDDSDIAIFAMKWFAAKDPIKSKIFVQKLKTNSSIRELATNPLMLTLLCLVFEELADFPSNRAELYKEGIEILLKKWDAKRNIEREQIYKQLSIQYKADLLSQIAFITFERGEYFFRQQELEQHIADYIHHLPSVNTDDSALQLDSAAVLKSIEAQHGLLVERARGIYSFSHLTFQEYFTAREIVASSNPQAFETALKRLVSHVTDKRWREVFLLTAGMLRNADYMLQLMKQKIDDLLAQDAQLQTFLCWLSQKTRSVSVSYKPVIVRAFYFDLAITRILALFGSSLDLTRSLDRNFTRGLERTLALDLALDRTLALNQIVERSQQPHRVFEGVLERAITHAQTQEPQLKQELQQLKQQLPESGRDEKQFKQWWRVNGQVWSEQLSGMMIKFRNGGYKPQFSKQQREALKQYYDANQLLVDCLNSNYYVTRTVRAEIESTLLLPLAEIN
jgi:predicted NACHT family NTPase